MILNLKIAQTSKPSLLSLTFPTLRLRPYLHAKGLHFKADNARQVSLGILVVKDRKAEVIVKEELDSRLALKMIQESK